MAGVCSSRCFIRHLKTNWNTFSSFWSRGEKKKEIIWMEMTSGSAAVYLKKKKKHSLQIICNMTSNVSSLPNVDLAKWKVKVYSFLSKRRRDLSKCKSSNASICNKRSCVLRIVMAAFRVRRVSSWGGKMHFTWFIYGTIKWALSRGISALCGKWDMAHAEAHSHCAVDHISRTEGLLQGKQKKKKKRCKD